MAGYTGSDNFPTTAGAYDPGFNGNGDGFMTKLNAVGSGLTYATFLGGSDSDGALAVAVDDTDSVYVTGYTSSDDFPTTPGAFDTSYNSGRDAYVAKLDMSSDQPCCDFDGDGTVDLDDIIIIANLWVSRPLSLTTRTAMA